MAAPRIQLGARIVLPLDIGHPFDRHFGRPAAGVVASAKPHSGAAFNVDAMRRLRCSVWPAQLPCARIPAVCRSPSMPEPSASPLPASTSLGTSAVAVQGDNLAAINTGTITTNVVLQISGDDAEKNLAVARAVLQATLQAAPVDPQRKADLMAYYEAIARTLEEAAEELRQGRIPHGRCGALRGHAEQLPLVAGDVIGPDMADAIARKLLECYEVERFGTRFMHLPPAERDEKFALLDDAAGYLRAAGQALRVRR
jgi:hypothetical protein